MPYAIWHIQVADKVLDHRSNRNSLFDGIEEGGIRASSLYSAHEIDEHDNERSIDGLQDRVNILKRDNPEYRYREAYWPPPKRIRYGRIISMMMHRSIFSYK
ncbi:hypothetical protein ACLOJK_015458 [Asimina triloba]